MAQRTCVTGPTGLADRANGTLKADLTDYGQAVEAPTVPALSS
jgi:hypothetical protein